MRTEEKNPRPSGRGEVKTRWNLYFTEQMLAQLRNDAAAQGISVAELVRRIISAAMRKKSHTPGAM